MATTTRHHKHITCCTTNKQDMQNGNKEENIDRAVRSVVRKEMHVYQTQKRKHKSIPREIKDSIKLKNVKNA